MAHPDSRRGRGDAGEQQAREYLEAQGLRCLAAGWRCRLGELDLVMQDDTTLVFVEVRLRRAGNLVTAIESIDDGKRRRLARAARAWLSRHPQHAALPARFDIIAIDSELQWLRDAFSVPAW